MKRLVSAIFNDFYPFQEMGIFDSYHATMQPDDLKDNDVLVVWGGEDIFPGLYGHGRSRHSGASPQVSRRDWTEWKLMNRAKELNIPIIGVCRGAQMLCALAGGSLIQHVNNHSGNHTVHTFDGKELVTNSVHHQMMNTENTEHKLIAWTEPRGTEYWACPKEGQEMLFKKKPDTPDPEFVHFTGVNGFAVQWHPEFVNYPHEATDYLFNYIKEHING